MFVCFKKKNRIETKKLSGTRIKSRCWQTEQNKESLLGNLLGHRFKDRSIMKSGNAPAQYFSHLWSRPIS